MNDPNHPGYGEDMVWTDGISQRKFIPGTWHHVVTQIVMNDPSQKNGIIRSWFDGKLSLERNDISFRTVSDFRIDKFYISTFYGGSDSSWASNKDMYIYFDEFTVVTDRSEVSPGNTKNIKNGYFKSMISGKTGIFDQYYPTNGRLLPESFQDKSYYLQKYRGVLISKSRNGKISHKIFF